MIDFKNKKVTVMGLGLYEEGSGIAAVKFLIEAGAKVTITDLKTEKQLMPQLKRLGSLKNKVRLVLGHHNEVDFKNVDAIIRNPAVPKSSKFLQLARKNKIPIYNDISLFFKFFDRSRIIGITGTRGKSTTSSLIYEFIKTINSNVVLGGNIKKSPLLQLKKIKTNSVVVLELSSWLLEELEYIKQSPHISVFTNIYPDHLNTYVDMDDYINAKKNIFKFQNPQDYLVINRDNKYTFKAGKETLGSRFWISLKYFKEENGCFIKDQFIYFRKNGVEQKICSLNQIALIGKHNLENILAAVSVAMIFGVGIVKIKKVLKNFKGIDSRLEFLREVGGVKYYNDTTSTTPEATMAALDALSDNKKNIILIAGGSDKDLEFKKLVKKIKQETSDLILLSGTGTERLIKEFQKIKYDKDFKIAESMSEAVNWARKLAKKNQIILLSPACASFGMFINEFDRGTQFRKLVNRLK